MDSEMLGRQYQLLLMENERSHESFRRFSNSGSDLADFFHIAKYTRSLCATDAPEPATHIEVPSSNRQPPPASPLIPATAKDRVYASAPGCPALFTRYPRHFFCR